LAEPSHTDKHRFRQRLLTRLLAFASSDRASLRVVLPNGEAISSDSNPKVTLTFRSWAVVRFLLAGRIGKLGDAYAAGDIGVGGSLRDILQLGIALAERFGRVPRFTSTFKPLSWLTFRHTRSNDAAAVQSHYDVSNDFYELWLDESMTYSCAYFRTGLEDIRQAQVQKIDHISAKLRLKPGDRLLDIGCGWGGFIRRAAREQGICALGVTNSKAQYEFARARIAEDGLNDKVEVRLQDYRDIPGDAAFDKIVSVGMYEHVGLTNLPTYFGTVARLLKPGGAFLNHGIVATNADGVAQGPPGGEFINRHVFPGGELPSLPRALQEIARCSLEPVDIEDLRPHYARTLFLWVSRFEAQADEVIRTAGEERYRVWRLYLAGMAHAFDAGWLSVVQVLAYKPVGGRPSPRPFSRAYQYRGEEGVAIAGPLEWPGETAERGQRRPRVERAESSSS
jgi:cyclopropane-fatty-acyl-phospholipid synthase